MAEQSHDLQLAILWRHQQRVRPRPRGIETNKARTKRAMASTNVNQRSRGLVLRGGTTVPWSAYPARPFWWPRCRRSRRRWLGRPHQTSHCQSRAPWYTWLRRAPWLPLALRGFSLTSEETLQQPLRWITMWDDSISTQPPTLSLE